MLLFAIIEVLFALGRCLYLFHTGEKSSIFSLELSVRKAPKKAEEKKQQLSKNTKVTKGAMKH